MKLLFTFLTICLGWRIYGQPSIISFSPDSGSVGTLVTITGTNLSNPTALSIGDTTAIIVSNTGDTLKAMVMPGAITSAISITTADGTAKSSVNFTKVSTPWPGMQQGNKLTGSDASSLAYQGQSVALSADGNTAIVGGYNDDYGIGAAWIYTRTANGWKQQGKKLAAPDTVYASLGGAVSLSADGNTAIVGAAGDNSEVGSAWVYIRNGITWTLQSKLTGSDAIGGSHQGCSVSLSADGNTAIVGGLLDNYGAGAAWIFNRSGSTWTQQGNKLVGTGANDTVIGVNIFVGAYQGISVALSADGNTAIVGGSQDSVVKLDGNDNYTGYGAAWVYTRIGNSWIQQGNKIVDTDSNSFAAFGTSVSLSADGNTAIVGGPQADGFVGASWVFTRTGNIWSQQSKLAASDIVGIAEQGFSVSLSADGNTAVVGGWNDNSGLGATWVYTRSGSIWKQRGSKLVGSGSDQGWSVGNCTFQGGSVFLSADGTTAIVGGSQDRDAFGASWIFVPLATPTIQAENIIFANISSTQMDIRWTKGNGNSRVVFVKEGIGIITNPLDSTTYTASANWTNKGSQLGISGYYCVYNGDGNMVTLTGLSALTQYTVQVFEYNGAQSNELYLTNVTTNNPNTQTTPINSAVTYISIDKPNAYPNPTNGLVTIDILDGKLTVIDVEGKVLIKTALDKDKTIDISKYDSGIYFLILKTKDNIYQYKIIKR